MSRQKVCATNGKTRTFTRQEGSDEETLLWCIMGSVVCQNANCSASKLPAPTASGSILQDECFSVFSDSLHIFPFLQISCHRLQQMCFGEIVLYILIVCILPATVRGARAKTESWRWSTSQKTARETDRQVNKCIFWWSISWSKLFSNDWRTRKEKGFLPG